LHGLQQLIRNTIAILHREERKKALILIGMNLLVAVLDVVFLACLLYLVQLYSGGKQVISSRSFPVLFTDASTVWPIGIFFVLFAVKNFASYLVFRSQCRFRYEVALRLSRRNLVQFLDGSYQGFVEVDSSVVAAWVNLQPTEFCQYVMEGIQQSIAEWTLIVLTVTAILLFNAQLFLLLLVVLLPPVFLASWLTRRQLATARTNIAVNRTIAWQHLEESIEGFVESNLFDKKRFFVDRYHRSQLLQNRLLSAFQALQGAPSRLAEVFAVFGLLALISLHHILGHGNGAAFVTLGAFLAAAYKIIPGVTRILNLNGQIRTYAYTVDDLLKRRRKASPPPEGLSATIDSISFRNIGFRYNHLPVLKGFNLDIGRGSFLGIEGSSGRGKTTLLNILLGFVLPDTGAVLFNGMETDLRERRGYWKAISYVKQQPFILNDTLATNITLEEEGFRETMLNEAIRIAGLEAFVQQSPAGILTRITENGKNISGGQRQRLMIARALYKDADVFILDEPFSELDENSEERLLDHFRQLAHGGKIVILITHNRKSLSWCNAVVSLEEPVRS
jgi:ABC-type bacteriocin/lantibiotic exporter with double-glycine peptidase domain